MAEPERDSDPIVGRTLGDFVVRKRIGAGGFGAVYLASQLRLEREAVVKVLHRRLRESPDATERFLREAKLATRLDHPYAAHVYAFGAEPEGLLWIAMELVRGTPLDQILRVRGPLPLAQFVPLLERMCEVVHNAHEHGIVHRDLKPANVMVLARAGRLLPKLLDFGVAKSFVDGAGPIAGSDTIASAAPMPGDAPAFAPGDLDVSADTAVAGTASAAALPSRGTSPSAVPRSLTQHGAIVGSPPYMAPEQWSNATTVDARADLYALGVLAFECLTGKLPFGGRTLAEYARAHVSRPVPSLGQGFPASLDAVLRKALAKRPEDRYPDALALAAAFRAAAGVDIEAPVMPGLEAGLRDELLGAAPQPIAESVAALEAAHGPRQARDALWRVVQTAVRYLGVVALAARARLAESSYAPAVAELMRALAKRTLTDEEWVELVRETCRPLVGQAAAHPVPELVKLFFHADGTPAAGARHLETLLELRAEGLAPTATDEALLPALERGRAELGGLLTAAKFLAEYVLALPVAPGRAEPWMGVRRSQRAGVPVRGPALAAGAPVLLDRDGTPVVALHPIAQVAPPAPGAAPELFLYEGHDRRGPMLRALPLGFGIHDDAVQDWLRRQLSFTLDEAGGGRADERAPYQGLSPFTADQAALFFGREKAIDAFVNRLQVQPLLAVVGPSGAGKSSFVQAGVIPALPRDWRALVFRPGPSPTAALRRALGEEPRLLVVDQFEEVFTLCREADERRRFIEEIVALCSARGDEGVTVVLTLRDDFLVRAEQVPALRDRLGQGLQLLTTPAPDDLLRTIVEPARRAGYEFEDPELPARMVAEVADQPSALALLSFTAAKLWELRDRQFKRLPTKSYEQLGGVGGALARHAETTLAEMRPDMRALVRVAFRHLVTSEGTRAVLERRELLQVLGGTPAAEAMIEHLVAARLLTASESEDGSERVEVVHEALLGAWPRLGRWLEEDAEALHFREQLRQAARQWDDRGRGGGFLWRGDALRQLEHHLPRQADALTATEEAFARACRAEAQRVRRAVRLIVGGVVAVLSVASVMLWFLRERASDERAAAEEQRRVAEAARDRADHLLVDMYQESGRQALLSHDYGRAAASLVEAYVRGADSPALRFMLAEALRPLRLQPRVLDQQNAPAYVHTVQYSPDGTSIVVAGYGGAKLWTSTGTLVRSFDEGAMIRMARWSPDGRTIATAGQDGAAKLWDAGTGSLRATLQNDAPVLGVAFDAAGDRVVTWGLAPTALVWDQASGRLLASLAGEGGRVYDARFSPSGALIATGSADGVIRLWDAGTGKLARRLEGHRGPVRRVEFAPAGDWLASGGDDADVRIWALPDGALLQLCHGHAGPVLALAIDRDSSAVLSASADATAKLWNARTGSLAASLEGHRAPIWSAVIAPDGHRFLTSSWDGTARLWDGSGVEAALLVSGGGERMNDAVFAPDGVTVASGGEDGAVRLWSSSADVRLRPLLIRDGRTVVHVQFGPDSARLLAVTKDHVATIWDVASGRELESLELPAGGDAWFGSAPDELVLVDGRHVRRRRIGGNEIAAYEAPERLFVATSAPGRIAAVGASGQGYVWDAGTRALEWQTTAERGMQVLFSADGRWLVGSKDRQAVVWDAKTGRIEHAAPMSPSDTIIGQCGDGDIMVVGAGRLWTWNPRAGTRSEGVEVSAYISMSPGPDCGLIVAQGEGLPAVLLDARTGRRIGGIESRAGLAYATEMSPDGRFVAGVAAPRIWLWRIDLATEGREELAAWARCSLLSLAPGSILTTSSDCPK
jgi:WD40 repeat protein/serine/threonine protein kinase